MKEFTYLTYPQEILFAPGALDRLGEAAERHGWQRLMLCTSRSVRVSGHAAAVEALLGERLVAVLDPVQPHVQDVQVSEACALASEKKVDAVIGMGGGSSIGMAKAVASRLEEEQMALHPGEQAKDSRSRIGVAAVPTTYAGSEMTPVFGVTTTRETPPRKVTVTNPQIVPQLVLYDPLLTLDLPGEITASTGINALAHCIEALYSITRNPLSTAAALSAVRHIHQALPCCYAHGDDLAARGEMLLGAHLAGLSLASVKMGLHHGLCHVLGGTANVPHGIANAIILPHAVRFNAEATALQLLPAAEAMGVPVGVPVGVPSGIPPDGREPGEIIELLAESISALTREMSLPQRLREAGVMEADLPLLAELAFQNRTVQNNPRPITDAAQIEGLLREAW